MSLSLEKRKKIVAHEPLLMGTNIFLEGLSDKHVSKAYANWLNDEEVCRENRHGRVHNTLHMTREYVRSVDRSDSYAVFAIINKMPRKQVGNISLGKISWENNSAEISIIIGEKQFWGKGIATEAYRLIIRFAFNTLGLHRVFSGMTVRNKGMIHVARKVGMKQEGILRDEFYKDGVYVDVVRFGLINPEHKKRGVSAK